MAYAEQAMEFGNEHDNVKVNHQLRRSHIDGNGRIVGVGMGSARKPCMVIFEINPDMPGPSLYVLLEKELHSTLVVSH